MKYDIKKICDNIEDVVFNNVDLSNGPDEIEKVLFKIASELIERWSCK